MPKLCRVTSPEYTAGELPARHPTLPTDKLIGQPAVTPRLWSPRVGTHLGRLYTLLLCAVMANGRIEQLPGRIMRIPCGALSNSI